MRCRRVATLVSRRLRGTVALGLFVVEAIFLPVALRLFSSCDAKHDTPFHIRCGLEVLRFAPAVGVVLDHWRSPLQYFAGERITAEGGSSSNPFQRPAKAPCPGTRCWRWQPEVLPQLSALVSKSKISTIRIDRSRHGLVRGLSGNRVEYGDRDLVSA